MITIADMPGFSSLFYYTRRLDGRQSNGGQREKLDTIDGDASGRRKGSRCRSKNDERTKISSISMGKEEAETLLILLDASDIFSSTSI